MSVMVCDYCDAYIDTDYDVEGRYFEETNTFMCSMCNEEYEDDEDESIRGMKAKDLIK